MAILGIGTEIIEIVRISNMIEAHGEVFLDRVFTADEVEYCVQTTHPSQHFATRWVAKEAAMKAMRCRNHGIRWKDIELAIRPEQGAAIELHGAALSFLESSEIERLHVSVGACRTHATAYVIATDDDLL